MNRDAALLRERSRQRRSEDVVGTEQVDLDGSSPLVRVARGQWRYRPKRRGGVYQQLGLPDTLEGLKYRVEAGDVDQD
jgi:hypothetical protein